MLAARRSFGNLRSAARAQQCAAVSPAVSQRSFMSAVLLSRDQFTLKTVVELKKQLNERGLSTKGKKKDLVDRLVDSVSKGTFGHSASTSSSSPSSIGGSSRISPSQTSSFSTTSRATAENNAKTATGTVVESAEIPVHAPAAEAAANAMASNDQEAAQANSDELTAGPGLLVNKEEAAQVAEKADEVPGGSIEMPRAVYLPSVEREIQDTKHEMMIPEMPHTYKNPVDHDAGAQPFTLHPSWIKVDADASTSAVHHAGGSNHVTEDPDSRSSEPRQEIDTTDSNTLLQDLLADLGIKSTSAPKKAKKRLENAEKELSMILSLLEETSGIKIPPISEPVKTKGSEEEFKFQDRPLNSIETTGLWTLAGILGGGLLLGTLGSGKKTAKEKEVNNSKKH